ncbi:MAG: hypothetical protein ACSLE8_07840 [Rhodococcus sp. (in: high G+C Gram-positive bacteria)]
MALLPDIAEAARANQRTVDRFVPPRLGIVEETYARRQQLVFGRRGVGKSTLLRTLERRAANEGQPVVYIDLENLRGIPYPDVLIQLLVKLCAELQQTLKRLTKQASVKDKLGYYRLRYRVRRLSRQLSKLLSEPQEAEHVVTKLKKRAARIGGSGSLPVNYADIGVAASAEGSSEEVTSARFRRTKMEGLFAASSGIREVLERVMALMPGQTGFILLDDFYHVPTADQPYVLSYLHQIVKNIDIYLKVCGVRHRLNTFIDSDPPVGLQRGQDAAAVSLDLTLEQFTTAQSFLEKVLAGVCAPHGIEVDELLTEGGRTRLVVGSGGVARDYLNLTRLALRNANERDPNPSRPHNRITAEDVNHASRELSEEKQNDLVLDAGEEAESTRDRLNQIVRFCLDHNKTNVFLVERTKLDETEWGKQVQSLADLRLVHEIGSVSIQSSDFRGRPFVAFTLDLSHYTVARSERIRQIEFWTSAGAQDIRRVGLIYDAAAWEPDELRKPSTQPLRSGPKPVDWEEVALPLTWEGSDEAT